MAGNETTFPGPVFVGSEAEQRIVGRGLIPFMRGLLADDPNLHGFPMKGHLSDWIRRLRANPLWFAGLAKSGRKTEVLSLFANLMAVVMQVLNASRERNTSKFEAYFASRDLRRLEAALIVRDYKAIDEACAHIARKAGVDLRFDVCGLFASVRALKATGLCLALHAAHPLDLLKLAERADRSAVLRLIRADPLFRDEPAVRKVIRQATLENDRRFSKQIARAGLHPPKIRQKMPHRVVLYGLFALGCKLPSTAKLFALVDPDGTAFKTTEAFEKFCERCRKDFQAICSSSSN